MLAVLLFRIQINLYLQNGLLCLLKKRESVKTSFPKKQVYLKVLSLRILQNGMRQKL